MRWIILARALPVVVAVVGPIAHSPAGDDLFLRSYQPYLKAAPSTASTGPSARLDSRITQSPTFVTPPVSAPASPATTNRRSTQARTKITWLKGGRGPAVGLPPAEALPPTTPASGQTVATALSVVAHPPDYVPAESKGLAHRLFGQADPEVPPGLSHGEAHVAMIPPESLTTSPDLGSTPTPTLARIEPRLSDGPAPTRGYSADLAASQSSYAPTAVHAPGRSLFAPVRPHLSDDQAESDPQASRRPTGQPAPFLIARPL